MVMHRDSGLVLDTRNFGLLRDYSRNHHTLTNHGAMLVRGKFGKGMLFDGVNDYIDCGNDSSLDFTEAITISVWVKLDEIKNQMLVQKMALSPEYTFYLYLQSDGKVNAYISEDGTGVNRAIFTTINTVDTTNWWHIVLTFGDSVAKIYLNGINQVGVLNGSVSSIHINTADLEIGRFYNDSEYVNGTIASVKIYNRALSAYEIAQHYHACSNYGKLSSAPKIL